MSKLIGVLTSGGDTPGLNALGAEFVKAVGVTERAFALEAGRAVEVEADDGGFIAQRRGMVGAG